MKRPVIVADDRIPFLQGVLEPYCDVTYLPGGKIDRNAVRNADAVITRTRTRCNAELLEGSTVRLITTATIGFDHIDTDYVEKSGITWFNAPGCNAASVRQYIASALLSLSAKYGFSLAGKTLGVVGVGHVGKLVADLGERWGMRVLRNDPPREEAGEKGFVSLDELLEQSDMVTLHVPLEYEGKYPTFHMADEKFFSKMRKGAIFFNASRGEAMDSEAVKKALKSGQIAKCIIDVWENEPAIDRELMEMSFISTMHIAGYSTDGKANGTAASVQAVARCLNIPELFEWTPETIPEPLEAKEIPFAGVKETVLHTYDPARDSDALKKDTDKFEELRGSYPIRREFQAFTVTGVPEEKKALLKSLGFNIG